MDVISVIRERLQSVRAKRPVRLPRNATPAQKKAYAHQMKLWAKSFRAAMTHKSSAKAEAEAEVMQVEEQRVKEDKDREDKEIAKKEAEAAAKVAAEKLAEEIVEKRQLRIEQKQKRRGQGSESGNTGSASVIPGPSKLDTP